MKRFSVQAIIAFLLMLSLCLALVSNMIHSRYQNEILAMEALALEKSYCISDALTRLLLKTEMLSVHIQHNDGKISDFEALTYLLIDNPAIMNILIAPNGVVSEIYPLGGNEVMIGIDFLEENAGDIEAIIAMQTRAFMMDSPYYPVQCTQILVDILPVFIDEPDGSQRFWGIVAMTLRYPDILINATLDELSAMSFGHEIWRINPDSGERQIIVSGELSYPRFANFVETPIPMMNSDWHLRVFALQAWYTSPKTWLAAVLSVAISLKAAAVMQNYKNLKVVKDRLEALSIADPLTGIYNRRYFMETVALQMERIIRQKSKSFIIVLDLDYFKAINDKFGHQTGDMVLKETANRVAAMLRPYDIFARYGGEEFIIFVSDTDKESAMGLAERIRHDIAKNQILINDSKINITSSFGIAPAAPINRLEEAISLADKALYIAKDEGRNRVVFYDA